MAGTVPRELQAVGAGGGMILALLALLFFPDYGAVAELSGSAGTKEC
jgi:hypothetical protein